MSVSGVSSALEQYQIKQDTTQKKDLGKNEFLELLVAQLNNQNPLEPQENGCLLYTSPSPRDGLLSRMPSSA